MLKIDLVGHAILVGNTTTSQPPVKGQLRFGTLELVTYALDIGVVVISGDRLKVEIWLGKSEPKATSCGGGEGESGIRVLSKAILLILCNLVGSKTLIGGGPRFHWWLLRRLDFQFGDQSVGSIPRFDGWSRPYRRRWRQCAPLSPIFVSHRDQSACNQIASQQIIL